MVYSGFFFSCSSVPHKLIIDSKTSLSLQSKNIVFEFIDLKLYHDNQGFIIFETPFQMQIKKIVRRNNEFTIKEKEISRVDYNFFSQDKASSSEVINYSGITGKFRKIKIFIMNFKIIFKDICYQSKILFRVWYSKNKPEKKLLNQFDQNLACNKIQNGKKANNKDLKQEELNIYQNFAKNSRLMKEGEIESYNIIKNAEIEFHN